MLWRAFETLGWGVAYYQTAQAAGKYFRSSLGKSSSHGPATELAPPPPPPTLLCADTSSASTATASATAIGVTATPPGGGQDLKTTETTREGEEEDLGKNWVAFWTVATIIGDHVAICMPIRRVFLFLSVVSRGAFPGWFWRRILRPIAEENEEKVEELVDWVKMKVLEHGLRLVDLGLTEANLKLMASLLWSLRRGGVKKGIVEALEAVAGGRDIVAYSSPDTKSRKASRKRARGEDYELGDGRPCKLLVMEATPAACRSGPRPSCRESGDKCE